MSAVKLERFSYLAYYLKRMNWSLLWRFMKHTKRTHRISYVQQAWLLIWNSLRYNISLLESYQFGFFDLSPTQRQQWAGTGTMYEFQRIANPLSTRGLLSDKRRFYQAYRQFFRHEMLTIAELQDQPETCRALLEKHTRLVLKKADGNCGAQVAFVQTSEFLPDQLVSYMRDQGFDLVETYVEQHADLARLSPTAVNTVRIFTLLDSNGQSRILGCRLRISINSPVDNMAAGNVAAPIDETTGVISGPAVFSDITKPPIETHPITGVKILGFQVPFWTQTLELAKSASKLHPENRSIGWDIVITPEGPGLIEGNHDWCKLVWQLPVQRGLKHLIQ